jgi:surfeit locus 1 family protein
VTSPGAGEPARAPRTPATLALLAVLALSGIAALIALGTWQLHRRVWKLDLIAQVEARTHAAPVAAPGPADWPAVNAARDAYRKVRLRGNFANDRETLVQAATERGAGFWVMTPLRTREGFTVLVNRGFVPPELRDPARRAKGQIAGEAVVTGLMRMTEPKGGFLRSNDPARDRWYSRDVAAIAHARGLRHVAPYFVDAGATPNPGGVPVGGLTVVQFPNSHLSYAITWFALAILLAGGAVIVLRHELEVRRSAGVSS